MLPPARSGACTSPRASAHPLEPMRWLPCRLLLPLRFPGAPSWVVSFLLSLGGFSSAAFSPLSNPSSDFFIPVVVVLISSVSIRFQVLASVSWTVSSTLSSGLYPVTNASSRSPPPGPVLSVALGSGRIVLSPRIFDSLKSRHLNFLMKKFCFYQRSWGIIDRQHTKCI